MEDKLEINTNVKLGWGTFSKRPAELIIGYIIYYILGLATCCFLYGPLTFGYTIMCLDAAKGKKVSIGDVFNGFKNYFPQGLILWFLWYIMFWVGLAFAVIPGLIVAYLFQWSFFIMVDQKKGAMESLKESYQMNVDNLGPTLVFFLVWIAIACAGTIVGLGILITVPIACVIQAHGYLRAFKPTV